MADFDDHNAIHPVVGLSLPTGLVNGSPGHVRHHRTIHDAIGRGLPLVVEPGVSPDHAAWHAIIAQWIGEASVGIRGTAGVVTGYTVQPTGSVEVQPGATSIQDAIAANPDNTVFWLRQGTYNITSVIVPKPGNQFLGEKTAGGGGVQITKGGTIQYGIAVNNTLGGITSHDVKIKNIYFSGFDGTGFANGAAVSPFRANRWEVANCDFANNWWGVQAAGDTSDSGDDHYIHHNYFHGAHHGCYTFHRANGLRFEDNELTEFTELGGSQTQKILGTPSNPATPGRGAVFAHNWVHDGSGHAFWMDTNCVSTIVEWNLIEDLVGGAAAIEFEACTWTEPDSLNLRIAADTKNVVRYNLVRNCNRAALAIFGSSWVEAYENEFSSNQVNFSAGEVQLELFQAMVTPTFPDDIRNNWIHHNFIKPLGTKNAVYANATTLDSGGGPYDRQYIIDNLAQNNFDFNEYHNIIASRQAWSWVGTLRNFADWQAQVFQSGVGPGQDVNSTRSDT